MRKKLPHNLILRSRKKTIPITIVSEEKLSDWLKKITPFHRKWLSESGFKGKINSFSLLPDSDGGIQRVVFIDGNDSEVWSWSLLASNLPSESFHVESPVDKDTSNDIALGWGMASYEFTRYRKARLNRPKLIWPKRSDKKQILATLDAVKLVRDLINTPAEDMGPSELALFARSMGRNYGASTRVIVGESLLKQNYPMIHTVGRASDDKPRLIDIRWGKVGPRVTLVGKGVCFDTGGLDIKSAAGMQRMKKDMGGAAHVLGLGAMIMSANLPIRLRVLIGAVENAVAGNSYRPLDVLSTRKGITVENTNTDAEGRLVLGDCLSEASREKPDLLIDYATLTGASRVAVGVEIAALYSNNDQLAKDIEKHSDVTSDPVWRLPLYQPYRRMLDSKVADLCSASEGPFGGGITAALFLKEFVDDDIPWAHFDIMAWNTSTKPGRPEGGDAQAMRCIYSLICDRFGI